MTVTETTVHKIDGQPFYVWKQKSDKTWQRSPVEQASQRSLEVITGRDEFEFVYQVKLPDMTGAGHMWIPLPSTDSFQTIDIKSIEAPGQQQIVKDHNHGNRIELSRGRDLVVEPLSGPINFLAYPVLEVDGKPINVEPLFSFKRKT